MRGSAARMKEWTKRRMRRSSCAASLLSLLVLGACVTVATGPPFSEAKAPPPPGGKATVYVYRRHAEPTAWETTIFFAANEVAALGQGGFTWAHVSPGALSVRATWPWLSGQKDSQRQLLIEPGRTYFLEVSGVSRGFCVGSGCIATRISSSLDEVSPELAPAAIEKCCKYRKASTSLY